jgi:hypothetical protein
MATNERDFEAEGRANKAGHIARYARSIGVSAGQVSAWTDDQWLAAATASSRAAGIKRPKLPSVTTRGIVADLLAPVPDSSGPHSATT